MNLSAENRGPACNTTKMCQLFFLGDMPLEPPSRMGSLAPYILKDSHSWNPGWKLPQVEVWIWAHTNTMAKEFSPSLSFINMLAAVSIGTKILPEGNLQSILECLVCWSRHHVLTTFHTLQPSLLLLHTWVVSYDIWKKKWNVRNWTKLKSKGSELSQTAY